MISNPCVIILDRATSSEREAVHEKIKENADGWWHHFSDAWIAGGHTPSEWVELLGPCIPNGPSGIMVLPLPEEKRKRTWGSYMPSPKKRGKWLFESYMGDPAPED